MMSVCPQGPCASELPMLLECIYNVRYGSKETNPLSAEADEPLVIEQVSEAPAAPITLPQSSSGDVREGGTDSRNTPSVFQSRLGCPQLTVRSSKDEKMLLVLPTLPVIVRRSFP